jgi:NADH dehydrogenase [ubiquinone] 1 alpha subcomplex assembly factor 7
LERLDHFMARANAAYYARHDPFADFTTAPEISQVFGEIIGLWAAVTWELLARPRPVLLAEAGPGRGTLMADALRAIGQTAPSFRAALSVHFIETSPRLAAAQAASVPEANWHDSLETLPNEPTLLIANEFLDALPIRQFVRRAGEWTERYVQNDRFTELPCGREARISPSPCGRGPGGGGGRAETRPPPAREELFELRESAQTFAGSLGARLAAQPGAALFLDYGPTESTSGDSLQAIRDGRPTDPLAEPGTADLTAHVDFAAFAAAARAAGAAAHGPIPQGIFLTRLGLFQRTDQLARNQHPAEALALIDAANRLAEPNRMGWLFKALALCHPACPTPPGFES